MWAFLLDEKKYQESMPKKLFDKRNIKGSIQFVFSGNIDNSWFPHITFYIIVEPRINGFVGKSEMISIRILKRFREQPTNL